MKLLDRFEEWFITFLIGAATLIIVASVIHRYLSGWPIPGQDFLLGLNFGWAQELCIIMFVWMAKFGAAYGVRTGIHVGVDVLINRLSDRNRSRFVIFGLLARALFSASSPPSAPPSCGRTAPTTRSSAGSVWISATSMKARPRRISNGRPGWSIRRFR